MNVTLIGYGKMGKEVENILLQRGHSIILKINSDEELKNVDSSDNICIDFTTPEVFRKNYKFIADKFAGAVVGTTGWNNIEEDVKNYFKDKNKKLIYGSNFSVGVNIFFNMLEKLSEALSNAGGYYPYILEMHHNEKKDAPSGTAKTAQKIVEEYFGKEIYPASIRAGNVKGMHEAGFESSVDRIILKHEAYSREGFAFGAVLAAEWMQSTDSIHNFRDLVKEKLKL